MWRRHVTQRKHWRISTKEQTEAQMEASHSPPIHLLLLCPLVGSWCQMTRENEKISSLDWTSSSCRSSSKHTVKTHMTPFGQNTFIRWNNETKFTFRLIRVFKNPLVAKRRVLKLPMLWTQYWRGSGGWRRVVVVGWTESILRECLFHPHSRCPSRCYLIVNRGEEKKQHASWPLGNWCHCFKLACALWIWIEPFVVDHWCQQVCSSHNFHPSLATTLESFDISGSCQSSRGFISELGGKLKHDEGMFVLNT